MQESSPCRTCVRTPIGRRRCSTPPTPASSGTAYARPRWRTSRTYVRNKDDAYRRLATRLYDAALAEAREAAAAPGTLAQRLDRALAAKLALTQRVNGDTPYAGELVGPAARVSGDLDRAFLADLADLLASTITGAAAAADLPLHGDNAREVAELALALARGLEADPTEPGRQRDRLRSGIALLIAGVAAATSPR
jgi:hypothetical protein